MFYKPSTLNQLRFGLTRSVSHHGPRGLGALAIISWNKSLESERPTCSRIPEKNNLVSKPNASLFDFDSDLTSVSKLQLEFSRNLHVFYLYFLQRFPSLLFERNLSFSIFHLASCLLFLLGMSCIFYLKILVRDLSPSLSRGLIFRKIKKVQHSLSYYVILYNSEYCDISYFFCGIFRIYRKNWLSLQNFSTTDNFFLKLWNLNFDLSK